MRKIGLLFILLSILIALTSACNSVSTSLSSSPDSNPAISTSSKATTQNEPFGKYTPTVSLTTILPYYESWIKLANGDTPENNVWTKAYLEELGIKINVLWTSTSDKADEKVNLAIASNEFPDFFPVNRKQFEQLVAAGKIEDLTSAIGEYASPFVKENILGDSNKAGVKAASVKGRIYGLPYNLDYSDSTSVLYIRADWLKKLNLPDPKTIDDLINVAKAFMTKDVDGTGKHAEYGIGFNKGFANPGLWNAFHAYPGIWVKDDATGKLVDGTYLPGMRNAVLHLQEWYKSGVIPKDFSVIDSGKMYEDLNSGKVGIVFGGLWDSYAYMQQGKDKDPKMEWKAVPIPSMDNTPASNGADALNIQRIYVVKKGYAHPEAAVKILNLTQKYMFDPITATNDNVIKYNADDAGNTPWVAAAVYAEPMRHNYLMYVHVKEAFKNNDPSKLRTDEKQVYDQITKYRNGDNSNWSVAIAFGPEDSTISIVDYYLKNNLYKTNEYEGTPTKTQIGKGSIITKLWEQTLTKVIMGSDISEYDAFVEKTKSLGHDEITKEINDWYAEQSK